MKLKSIGFAVILFCMIGLFSVSCQPSNSDKIKPVIKTELAYKVTGENTCAIIQGSIITDSDVTIPEQIDGYTVTTIENNAFGDRQDITSITIPGTVSSINRFAFGNCIKLESVIIEEGIAALTIASDAFIGCNNLKKVMIPSRVDLMCPGAFTECNKLTEISIDKENKQYYAKDSIIFYNDKKSIYAYPSASGRCVLPKNVVYIEDRAFRCCTQLTSIILPDSLTTIGVAAFEFCFNLESITIPSETTYLDLSAFNGCDKLTELTILSKKLELDLTSSSSCPRLSDISFCGTKKEWNALMNNSISPVDSFFATAVIHCTDGDISYRISL